MKRISNIAAFFLVVIALLSAASVLAASDGTSSLNVAPPPKTDGAWDAAHAVVQTSIKGSVRLPVKSDYKEIFYQFTGLIAAGGTRKATAANYVMDNSTSLHPFPCQINVSYMSVVASANTASCRLWFYNRGTFEGSGYSTDTFAASVNLATLTAAPYGTDYVQDVLCGFPLINLDKNNVIPFVIKNTGATPSRFYIGITYQ